MTLIITVLHILVSLSLIFVVLLQKGSGADMGAAFGGSSQSLFGSRGSGSFLGKMTATLAAIFMLTSLSLAFFTTQKGPGVSVMEGALPQTKRSETAHSKAKEVSQKPADVPLPPKTAQEPAKNSGPQPAKGSTPQSPMKPIPGLPGTTEGKVGLPTVPKQSDDSATRKSSGVLPVEMPSQVKQPGTARDSSGKVGQEPAQAPLSSTQAPNVRSVPQAPAEQPAAATGSPGKVDPVPLSVSLPTPAKELGAQSGPQTPTERPAPTTGSPEKVGQTLPSVPSPAPTQGPGAQSEPQPPTGQPAATTGGSEKAGQMSPSVPLPAPTQGPGAQSDPRSLTGQPAATTGNPEKAGQVSPRVSSPTPARELGAQFGMQAPPPIEGPAANAGSASQPAERAAPKP